MPGYFDAAPIKDGLNEYLRIYQPATENYDFVHHLADEFNAKRGMAREMHGAFVRHHKNFNRWDNRPTNQVMRQKIARYGSRLLAQFGRENLTPEQYEAHRMLRGFRASIRL